MLSRFFRGPRCVPVVFGMCQASALRWTRRSARINAHDSNAPFTSNFRFEDWLQMLLCEHVRLQLHEPIVANTPIHGPLSFELFAFFGAPLRPRTHLAATPQPNMINASGGHAIAEFSKQRIICTVCLYLFVLPPCELFERS